MKRLYLKRRRTDPERTEGELWHSGERFLFTMEPSREDEFPCIPAGFYHCVSHSSPKYPNTWALEGAAVSHWEDNDPATVRSTILFHAGNVEADTHGCLVLGTKRGNLNGEPAVLSSQIAMERLRELVGDQEFYLVVEEW